MNINPLLQPDGDPGHNSRNDESYVTNREPNLPHRIRLNLGIRAKQDRIGVRFIKQTVVKTVPEMPNHVEYGGCNENKGIDKCQNTDSDAVSRILMAVAKSANTRMRTQMGLRLVRSYIVLTMKAGLPSRARFGEEVVRVVRTCGSACS
jgi:hypothetical protein